MSDLDTSTSYPLHVHHHDPNAKYDPPQHLIDNAHVKSFDQYQQLYQLSVKDPEAFWSKLAEQFHWESKPTGQFLNYNFDIRKGPIYIKWLEGAKTNISYNMLDRHVKNELGNKVAFYWSLTTLILIAIQRGKPVDTCVVVRHLTPFENSNGVYTEDSPDECPVAKRPCTKLKISWSPERDFWWSDLMHDASEYCDPEWMDAEDPLFMLYTSGSTGKPKGVLHTVGGYMLYAVATCKYVFDLQPDDIYWCTADVGWITGHTYVCYGPLGNAVTGIIFEGTPFYPDAGRFWAVIEKYKVTKFYTAPTAIRSLMKFDDSFVTKHDRSSLKILGTVGEPINPEAWLWYHKIVGNENCAIVDTFWQTETGGHVITPLPAATKTKPGSATFPFFGIVPALLTDDGKEIVGPGEGYLVFKQPWPGIMRTVFNNHERFEITYFKKFPGYYTTGDGAKRDEEGYLWITGRIDDMVNVSGHLLSTAEVESALIEHEAVSEAASVSHPHHIKGECIYCFVTLKEGETFSDDLVKELTAAVRLKIGPFAQPDYIQNAPALPKTRSGKIMRRILRKIAVNDRDIGDTSTLADESVIDLLFKLRPKDA
uniref:acetate--CoA ligase n=1 Tax=Biomphalaria glabrata TaxID=6526 RepID=A0A2C9JRU6_BIOGL